MSAVKVVLFDLGSTLLEYENVPWETLDRRCIASGYRYLAEAGRPLPPAEQFAAVFFDRFRAMWRETERTLAEIDLARFAEEVLQSLGITWRDGEKAGFFERYYRPIFEQITPYPESAAVLESLSRADLRLGLVSNSIFPAQFHRQELQKFGLARFFDVTIFSSEFGWRKPKPEIFQTALEQLRALPQEAIFVGDRVREDIWGPQQVGMRAVLKWRADREWSAGTVPDAIIHSLVELPAVLEVLNRTKV